VEEKWKVSLYDGLDATHVVAPAIKKLYTVRKIERKSLRWIQLQKSTGLLILSTLIVRRLIHQIAVGDIQAPAKKLPWPLLERLIKPGQQPEGGREGVPAT